jgi:DNA-binding PadR family transcriptional regulator
MTTTTPAETLADSADDTLHLGKDRKHITPSLKAMLRHLGKLHENENMKWFSWRDFEILSLTHGTIRNNLCKLRKMGIIEHSHSDINSYYTLTQDSKIMTLYRIWVQPDDTHKQRLLLSSEQEDIEAITNDANNIQQKQEQLATLVNTLTYDAPSVHNIRLRFHCPNIDNTLLVLHHQQQQQEQQRHQELAVAVVIERILPVSEDLVLPRQTLENEIKAGIIVHRTDYVSISLACSNHPIHFDVAGLVKLTSCLSRLETQLQQQQLAYLDIPYYGHWLVTMWHVGVDSKERFTGPAFEETWEHVSGTMCHIYSKTIINKKNNKKLRLERQEYPKVSLHDAVEQKLSTVLGSSRVEEAPKVATTTATATTTTTIITTATTKFVPLSRQQASAFVQAYHRHNDPVVRDKFRIGLQLCESGELIGVAIAAKPVAYHLDDGNTVEIVRVCVKEGHPNACSMLYSRITKIAKLLGYEKVITYTLARESQSSMKALGAVQQAITKPCTWNTSKTSRPQKQVYSETKIRWKLLS